MAIGDVVGSNLEVVSQLKLTAMGDPIIVAHASLGLNTFGGDSESGFLYLPLPTKGNVENVWICTMEMTKYGVAWGLVDEMRVEGFDYEGFVIFKVSGVYVELVYIKVVDDELPYTLPDVNDYTGWTI